MISLAMAKRLLGGAASAAALAADVARHIAWYVSYQVDGKGRNSSERRARRR